MSCYFPFLIVLAPNKVPINFLADPVVPTPTTLYILVSVLFFNSLTTFFTSYYWISLCI